MTDETKKEDKKLSLLFFKDTKKKVHIKVVTGEEAGVWRNGFILAVTEDRFLMIDDVVGSCSYALEDISEKIVPYKLEGEDD